MSWNTQQANYSEKGDSYRTLMDGSLKQREGGLPKENHPEFLGTGEDGTKGKAAERGQEGHRNVCR